MKILIEQKQFDTINDLFLSQISVESADALRGNLVININQNIPEKQPPFKDKDRIRIAKRVNKNIEDNDRSIRINSKINSNSSFKREAGELLLLTLKKHKEERLRQAKSSYNAAIIFIVIGLILIIAAVIFTIDGGFYHFKSIISFICGIFLNIYGVVLHKLYKEANSRLDYSIAKDISILERLIR